MSDTPRINAELVALRHAIGGLKAEKKNGVMFAVKSAKDLMIKLRDAVDQLGMNVYPVATSCQNIELAPGKDGKTGTACVVHQTVRVVASDGSFVDFTGIGHGLDRDDKAAGKASTYAWKDALTKGLCLPDADMVDTDDESGHGPALPRKTKEKAAPSQAVADLEARILAATTAEDVKALTGEAKALAEGATEDERNRLRAAIAAAKSALGS